VAQDVCSTDPLTVGLLDRDRSLPVFPRASRTAATNRESSYASVFVPSELAGYRSARIVAKVPRPHPLRRHRKLR